MHEFQSLGSQELSTIMGRIHNAVNQRYTNTLHHTSLHRLTIPPSLPSSPPSSPFPPLLLPLPCSSLLFPALPCSSLLFPALPSSSLLFPPLPSSSLLFPPLPSSSL